MNYIRELREDIKGKTLYQQLNIIKKCILLENPKNYKGGVYFIEDFYIGKSKDILSRIASHVLEVLTVETSKKVNNREKLYLIYSILKTRKLRVKILTSNQKQEESYIKEFYHKFPLTNIEFVTDDMRLEKQKYIISKAKNKTFEFERFTSLFVVAKLKVNNNYVFKIAKTKNLALKSLNSYLKLPPKKDNTVSDKRIKDYKYVAISSKYVKSIFSQEERWKEKADECVNPAVKGFDNLVSARKWLNNKH